MNDEVSVVAIITAKPEHVAIVKNELLKMVGPTRLEDGCLEYRLHQDNENPALFLFYEIWESKRHLLDHTGTRHYLEYVAAVDGLIESKVVHKLTGLR